MRLSASSKQRGAEWCGMVRNKRTDFKLRREVWRWLRARALGLKACGSSGVTSRTYPDSGRRIPRVYARPRMRSSKNRSRTTAVPNYGKTCRATHRHTPPPPPPRLPNAGTQLVRPGLR